MVSMSSGKMTGVPGGIVIRDEDGQVLGAIGVSGSMDENKDEEIAKAAVSWWNY
tara:strand:+ start:256 stop:417 length:162 start_codon:yes stop_codon:yes gene_type:complete